VARPTQIESYGGRRALRLALALIASAGIAAVTPFTIPASATAAAIAEASGCPSTTDPGDFASAATLRNWNEAMHDFGPRPTGSRTHHRFVDWLQRRLDVIPGVTTSSRTRRFKRQTERSASLRVEIGGRDHKLALAAPLPYSKRTGKHGVSGPLVYLPNDTEISAANAAGRIVVRDYPAGELPNAAFDFVSWFSYDPLGTFDPNGTYKRDWLSSQPETDMIDASRADAAGVLFVHELPRRQIRGFYRPYHGIHYPASGLHLGVDEGERIKQAIASGAAKSARITLRARLKRSASTRMLFGRLPGPGQRRVVLQTHSDGVNALWDNGHVPMLAIARYFSNLPRKCRPGPMEFVFGPAHLYLRPTDSAASTDAYAEQLDSAYDRGEVAVVLSLEHLGGREWEAVERGGGRPGLRLRKTGLSEVTSTFVTESDFLVDTLADVIRRRDVERSLLLKGTTLPDDSHVPPWCSFGGEGTAYMQRLLPTVAFVASPWPLFSSSYGMELIDLELLREQSLMFNDFLLRMRGASQEAIAGKYTQYRADREAGKPTCLDAGA
jgi:hypothetical protein